MSSNANALPNLMSFPEDRQLVGLSNWAVFRDHLKSVARATGLTGYLDGTTVSPISSNAPLNPASSMSSTESTTTPVPATLTSSTFTPINSRTPSAEEWELRDGRLAGIIYQNIKDPRSVGVNDFMSAHGMWTRLTSEYDTSSAAAQSLAKERIQQYRYNAVRGAS
ncbi:hypothetical protein GGU11DRAFT_759433 [Lentinula aff. detonsa]|nr:hypothetical protein GGU11DRAFT_759433 [Lentinula aff. detonsa]